jgi:hypothetical protein
MIRVRLAQYGKDLAGRATARTILNNILDRGDGSVEFDFAGVRTLGPSFAHELFDGLLEELGAEGFRARVKFRREL